MIGRNPLYKFRRVRYGVTPGGQARRQPSIEPAARASSCSPQRTAMEFHRLTPRSCPAADPWPLTQPRGRALRIALLCPRGPLYRHRGGIWKKTMRYAPLTLTTLASLIPPEIPAEIALLDEGVDEIDPAAIGAD